VYVEKYKTLENLLHQKGNESIALLLHMIQNLLKSLARQIQDSKINMIIMQIIQIKE
jgi:hypothetical protein